jgi:signal transduction histidine kinase
MLRRLKTYQLVVDVALAVLFLLFALPFGTVVDASAPPLPLVAFVVLFAVAVAVRRLAPGLALGIAWLAAIVQMLGGLAPAPANVAVFVVLYAAAAYGTRLEFWLALASAVVGAVVIALYLFFGPAFHPSVVGWAAIPVVAAVLSAALFALLLSWTAGALVRTALRARETRIAQARAEIEAAAELERVRIARDMHDVVAHSLAVVIAQADGARYAAAADPEAASRALAAIATTSRAALADVRVLLAQLRHRQPDGPQPTLVDLDALLTQMRAAGLDIREQIVPPAGEPPAGVQRAVFRILQEALTNALRHGDGGPVELAVTWQRDAVALAVRNGRPPGTAAGAGGHGVVGMRERAHLVGGTLEAGSEGERYAVRASLPYGAVA